jgi:hypothetical protein
MRTIEEINGRFWHSVAAELHSAMSQKWLPIAGIAKISGVPSRQIEAMLSGVPPNREPKVSDIIAVMAVFGTALDIDTYNIDDVYAVTGPVPYDKQLSILDVLGQGWAPTEESSHDD